jgi:hypothetical protein
VARIFDFRTYRNGGIEFTVSGTEIDGRYRILHPNGARIPVVRDGGELPLGTAEVTALRGLLEGWLRDQLTPEAAAGLAELDRLPTWQNLPDRLDDAILLHRVRWIIERLQSQTAGLDVAAG